MLICLMGPSCTGKSTLAATLQAVRAFSVVSGKDYLRLAKSESEARRLFVEKLAAAQSSAEEHLIFVVTEPEDLSLLPEGAVRVRCTASSETIRERFAARMRGTLPPSVADMLEAKIALWQDVPAALVLRTDDGRSAEELAAVVLAQAGL